MRAIILLLSAALCCGSAHAAVPHQINFQGYLTAPGGAPVNTTMPIWLSLYNAATGGTALYSETQTVTVTNGVFNVLIGSVTPLPLPFDVPYWLGVTLGITDAEMTPRQPVAASAYAIRSATTEALAAGATVPGSQIIGPITTATLPAGNLSGTIGTAQLADASVTAAKLASNSCTAGQILKYTGTQWACGADSNSGGTVTSIAAGTGLTGGTITTTGTIGLGTAPVANGGTGQTTLAANGLVYGQGTGGVGVTASGATGQVLVGTGGAPAWSGTPTITGVIASGGGVKFPDGNIQTKALANCSAEGDVAVMHSGTWVCRSTLGYVDNGDGTVTDNKTGLMWEQKATCGGVNLGNAQCKENTYTWSATSPFTDPSGTLYSDFLQKLNGLDFSGGSSCFAGYCDWRIPTVGELRSLLTAQYPAVCPSSPCINAVFAPTTQASFYWSSSSLASVPNGAWGVGFNFGDVGFNNKSSNNYARAVRSGR